MTKPRIEGGRHPGTHQCDGRITSEAAHQSDREGPGLPDGGQEGFPPPGADGEQELVVLAATDGGHSRVGLVPPEPARSARLYGHGFRVEFGAGPRGLGELPDGVGKPV